MFKSCHRCMKYLITSLFVFCMSCIKDQTPTPVTPSTIWIDAATHNDTIITNSSSNIVYYAIKNWQSFPDSNFSNGFRTIIAAKGDSVYVSLVGSEVTKYYGPYLLTVNAAVDSLSVQNFLDTVNYNNPSKLYVLFH